MNQSGDTQKIIISGGFSKADAVCQKIANLTNADVHRSDNADATVQGAACMAASGAASTFVPQLSMMGTALAGTAFFVGYGLGVTPSEALGEMLTSKRYQLVYTIR